MHSILKSIVGLVLIWTCLKPATDHHHPGLMPHLICNLAESPLPICWTCCRCLIYNIGISFFCCVTLDGNLDMPLSRWQRWHLQLEPSSVGICGHSGRALDHEICRMFTRRIDQLERSTRENVSRVLIKRCRATFVGAAY